MQTELPLTTVPAVVRFVWDENALLIIGSNKELEKALYFTQKEMEEEEPDAPLEEGARKQRRQVRITRTSVAMFEVVNEQRPRAIRTHQGFFRRMITHAQSLGITPMLHDNRHPFPEPKLALMHGFRGSQGTLTTKLLLANESGALQAPTRFGKCLHPDTPVRMADGSVKFAHQIKDGDLVLGPDGVARRVTGVMRGRDMMFTIQAGTGLTWTCTHDHPTPVRLPNGEVQLFTAEELFERQTLPDFRKHQLVRVAMEYGVPMDVEALLARRDKLDPMLHDLIHKADLATRTAFFKRLTLEGHWSDPTTWQSAMLGTLHTAKELVTLAHSIGYTAIWCVGSSIRQGRARYYRVTVYFEKPPEWETFTQADLADVDLVRNVHGFTVKCTGLGDYCGFEIEGDQKLFCLEDGTVTHNTTIIVNILRAFPGLTTVVTLPGIDLVRQLRTDLAAQLPNREVKWVKGGSKKSVIPSEDISVCSIDSLHLMDNGRARLLLVDEPHAAVTEPRLDDITRFQKARRYAIGATLGMRFDGRDPLIEGVFGPTHAKISFKEAVAEGSICNIVALIAKIKIPCAAPTPDRDAAYAMFLLYSQRMAGILAWLMDKVIPPEWQTLVFIKNENQAKFYSKFIQTAPFIAMAKRMTTKERDEAFDAMALATIKRCLASAIYAQGVTFPDLRVVINMAGGGAYQSSVQKPGRLAQNRPGKRCGVLIDFLFEPEVNAGPEGVFQRETFMARNPASCLVRESMNRVALYQDTGYDVRILETHGLFNETFRSECL